MAIIKRKNMIFGGPKTVTTNYSPRDAYTFSTTSPGGITDRIGCWPIYINKKIFNPNFCMEITAAGSAGGVPVAIYNGSNGLNNAPVIWSGSLEYGGPTGVYKKSANISLEEGFYVLASCSNTTGSAYVGVRSAGGIRHVKSSFGDSTGVNSFNTTASAFEFTGTSLPVFINGNNITGAFSNIVPAITLEY
jgi:hypothetical protein